MIIDYKKIREISTEDYKKNYMYPGYTSPLDDTHHFSDSRAKAGGEHYQLLTYLSFQFNGINILDFGTNWGDSAIALSQNPNNKVTTYDINRIWEFPFLDNFENLEFKLMDANKEDPNIIKSATLIFLDIAHDGIQEMQFTNMLQNIGYKGYLICDDIHLPWSPPMDMWWNSISVEKYDITDIGHTWGTGLVNYYQDGNIKIIK
jgi:hypothetical protein